MRIYDSFFVGNIFDRCLRNLYYSYISGQEYFDDSVNCTNCNNHDINRFKNCCGKYADIICGDDILGKFLDLAYDKDRLEESIS